MHLHPWPDRPIDERPVKWAQLCAPDGALQWATGWDEWQPRLLSHELALRGLRSLDTTDAEAVLSFMNDHGAIDRPYPDRLASVPPDGVETPKARTVDIDDAAAFLRTAQCLVEHWIADQDQRPTAPIWRTAGFVVEQRRLIEHEELEAEELFAEYLSYGLQPYQPRLELGLRTFRPVIHRPRVPDLYDGLCLQIFNLVADRLPPRKCASPTCINYFVRQGEAPGKQHRKKGAKFCSTRCQNLEGQRRLRERRHQGQANSPTTGDAP